MSSRMRGWPVGVVLLLIVTMLSQVVAVAESADPEGAAGPDLSRVSPLVGNDFRISGPAATKHDSDPAVAYNSTNTQYLVVWTDTRNEGSRGTDIYGQLVSAEGTRIGGDFRISGPAATNNESDPVVAYNSINNEYLVVWVDWRNNSTRGSDIYGQRVKASGKLAGGDFRISGPAATSAVVYNPAQNSGGNQYLVVWQDWRNRETLGYDIYGQRVKATGKLAGGDFRISAATSDEQFPAVAYNSASNQYLVVWGDREDDIYGQRVKAGGKLAGGDFRISGPACCSFEKYPAVAYNTISNQYLVVWEDYPSGSQSLGHIRGQRVKANGKLAKEDFWISGPAATNESEPAVAYNPVNNRYLVVWVDWRNLATRGYDIYRQRVKTTGKLAGGDFRISGPAATGSEWSPTVAYNHFYKRYLVVWVDNRNGATRGWEIYGQRVAG